jgi:lycopene beta-cyclase
VPDVVVCGSGPAGWSLAAHCAERGLHTALIAPHPRRPWRPTYGAWLDELDGLPERVIAAAPGSMRATTTGRQPISRRYAILHNARLLEEFTSAEVDVITGRATGVRHGPHGDTVLLADGRRIAAAVAVDATGTRRALSGGPPRGPRVEQTALGVIVPAAAAEPVLGPDRAVLMDWTPLPGQDRPTFLYAVPLGGDRVLLEETSLARRPGLGFGPLRTALHARLHAAGVGAIEVLGEERVRFPVDLPVPGSRARTLAFGAAAAMVHPASGYSVGTALRLAPRVAEALATSLPAGPPAAVAAARRVLWSPAARTVQLLRRRGLAALLALSASQLRTFFAVFFALPEEYQRAYLSGREDPAGTTRAMAALFRAAPWSLRARLATVTPGRWSDPVK